MLMKIQGALTEAIDRASRKDISFLIRTLAISIFVISVGVACCLILYGSIHVEVKAKPPPASAK